MRALTRGSALALARGRARRGAAGELLALLHPGLELRRRQRRAEEIALARVAALAREEVHLRLALDALGHDAQPEPACEPDDRRDDGGARGIAAARAAVVDVVHEGLVDLEHVHGQVAQVREAR